MRKNKNVIIIIVLLISLLFTACSDKNPNLIENNPTQSNIVQNNSNAENSSIVILNTDSSTKTNTDSNATTDSSNKEDAIKNTQKGIYEAIDKELDAVIEDSSTENDSFGSLQNTLNTLATIGSRVLTSEGNELFGTELANKLKSYEGNEGYSFEEQEFIVNVPVSYTIKISNADTEIVLDKTNSRLKGYTNKKIPEAKAIVHSNLAFTDVTNQHIIMSENRDTINSARGRKNAILAIRIMEDIANVDNVGFTSNNGNYIMIDRTVYEQLAPFMDTEVNITSEIEFTDYTAKNYILTRKGKNSDNVIALQHILILCQI